jgi:2-polyprenyl-6-methoxyphenol hydroxylase-like FAD-dependent oxidoreductase
MAAVRIAVVGAGAMGSVYAALLAWAGNAVSVVDLDEAHVDAIRAGGLRVTGVSGERTVDLEATTDPDAWAVGSRCPRERACTGERARHLARAGQAGRTRRQSIGFSIETHGSVTPSDSVTSKASTRSNPYAR